MMNHKLNGFVIIITKIMIIINIVCNGISYMILVIISIMIMIIATHEHQIVHSHRVMTVITDTYMCY